MSTAEAPVASGPQEQKPAGPAAEAVSPIGGGSGPTPGPTKDPGGASAPAEPPVDSFSESDDDDAGDRVLPPETVRAYYGVSDSEVSGPAAFGPGATVIGVLNTGDEASAAEGFSTYVISRQLLDDTADAYVPTASDHPLRRHLATQNVAYLSGPLSSGRSTTAYVALAHRHASDRVAQIVPAPHATLTDIVGRPGLLREGFGHLLIADDRPLEMTQLAILDRQAEQRDATVIVVGRKGRHDEELSRFLVPHTGPLPADVFGRWLSRLLKRAGECLGACIAEPAGCQGSCVDRYVATCLAEIGARLRRLSEAEHAARVFARDTSGDGEVRARLAERAGLGLRGTAEGLLRFDPSGPDERRAVQHRQAFRLAYAVLNGHPLTHVFAATGALMDVLDTARNVERVGRPVLESNVDALLGEGVQAEPRDDLGVLDSGVARTARLRDPRLADRLLDVVWNDYDSAREPLMSWIKNLADSKYSAVRVAAAAAAGRLCGYDFNEIFQTIICEWAGDRVRAHRQAAAVACESAVYNEHLAGTVARWIRRWVRESSSYLRDTAARAYAMPLLGRTFTEYALVDIEDIVHDPAQARSDSIARVIEHIYRPEKAGAIFRMMDQWRTSNLPLPRGHADRCLVALAGHPADPPRDGRPRLLADAEDGLVPLADLAALWRSALRHPWTSTPAWERLRYWVSCADGDPQVDAILADLLRDVLHEPALRTRARFYRRRLWLDRPQSGTSMFDAILDGS